VRSTPYKDSLDSKIISPESIGRHESNAATLKVSVDLNDRNNYMPVALHPTEVVMKAREYVAEPIEVQEDSVESGHRVKSDSVYPSPSFRQPDLPF
jgi:hypothetical protein